MYFVNLRPYRALFVVVGALVLAASLGSVEVTIAATATGTAFVEGPWGDGPGRFGLGLDALGRPCGPACIAVDRSGRVYVVDTHNNRVVRYGRTGELDRSWQVNLDESLRPAALAVDGGGRVFVAAAGGTSVWRFDARGVLLGSDDVVTGEGGDFRWVLDAIRPDGRAGYYVMVTGQTAGLRVTKILRHDGGGRPIATAASWELAAGGDSGQLAVLPEDFCVGPRGELFAAFRDGPFSVRVERLGPQGQAVWTNAVSGETLIRGSALLGGDSRGAYVALDYGDSAQVVLVPSQGQPRHLAQVSPFRPPAGPSADAVPYGVAPGCVHAGRELYVISNTEHCFAVRRLTLRAVPRFRLFGRRPAQEVDPCG